MKPTESVYGRLHALSTKRYGLSWDGLKKTVRDVLARTWCEETAYTEPSAKPWSLEEPTIGQSDVTACYLATHVFSGNIALVRLRDRPAHFVIWERNGEGTTTLDFCPTGKPMWEVVMTFTPEEFLEQTRAKHPGQSGTNLRQRLAVFHERFRSALDTVEQETAAA